MSLSFFPDGSSLITLAPRPIVSHPRQPLPPPAVIVLSSEPSNALQVRHASLPLTTSGDTRRQEVVSCRWRTRREFCSPLGSGRGHLSVAFTFRLFTSGNHPKTLLQPHPRQIHIHKKTHTQTPIPFFLPLATVNFEAAFDCRS